MNKIILFFLILLTCSFITKAQEDVRIGQTPLDLRRGYQQGGMFDYSDPETVNITVQVWGYVKYPGQYTIPGYSDVNNLLSLAGGPTEDANIDDLRLFKFNYNDLLWNDELSKKVRIPDLHAGDVLLVPGEPRFFFKDYFSLITSLVGTLVSVATLLVIIYKK